MAQSVGEVLQKERARRGLTLEQVAEATHIRKHFLEALENNQHNALPSAVQGRGFLRLYAGHLGLPVEPLLAAWDGKAPLELGAPESAAETTASSDEAPAAPAVEEPAGAPDLQLDTPSPEETLQPDPIEAPQPVFVPVNDYLPTQTPGEAQQVFQEIGQQLRQQRESLGITLAEVERYTRVRQHYLRALEEGRIDGLPSTVQGRGMLSNYASFLNLDEEKILLRFAEGLQLRRVTRIPAETPQGPLAGTGKKRPAKQAPGWRRFLTPDLIFGVGVAGIILIFILWTASRITNLREQEIEPTMPAIAEILLTPPAGDLQETGETPTGGDPGSETAVAGENTGEETGETQEAGEPGEAGGETPAGQGQPTATFEVPAINGTAAPETPIAPPSSSAALHVYIVARQRAWLQVSVDNQVKYSGRVIPGNAYDFSGTSRIEIATGNAAAIQVFFNQSDLGTLGAMGQAVGLVFVPEGIMTPTPAFTATSTPTELPTMTLMPSATPTATPTVTPFVPQD